MKITKFNLLIFNLFILSISGFSQITFDKGYIINENGEKIECLIKNNDWNDNPVELKYKLSENDEIKTGNPSTIQEFEIYNASKYISKLVGVDISSDHLSKLSTDRSPIFKEEQLFLKVILEGKANLYYYSGMEVKRFFFNTEENEIEQLVFKSYKSSSSEIGKNYYFRQQLWNSLKCSTVKKNRLKSVKYIKSSLVKVFKEYNTCSNVKSTEYSIKPSEEDKFNLILRPRINNSSLSIDNSSIASRNVDFGSKVGFGFGVEAEFILPFNNNKWSFLIEPTYRKFKSESSQDASNISGGKLLSTVSYSSIEIPFSLRHYFYINPNSVFFANLSYIIDINSNSYIEFKRSDNSTLDLIDINSRPNVAFGIGYKWNKKFTLETRFQSNRQILGNQTAWNTDFKTFSIIFGFIIF